MFEIEISEISSDRIIVANFTGDLHRKAIIDFIDRMNAYEEAYPGFGLLFDLTNVTRVSVDIADFRSITGHLKEHDKTTGKTALLIGDNIGRYILAKLFVELANAFRPNREKTFRDKPEALAWLVDDHT